LKSAEKNTKPPLSFLCFAFVCVWEAGGAWHFNQFVGLDLKEEVSSITTEINPYEG